MHANASRSGTLKVGGDIATNRLGFGAMRLTGEGIWGEPADRTECLRQQAMMSQRFLEVEQVGLWQLHRIDPKVLRDEQFAAI